jgi:iron complex outermembrane receptor protein
MSIKSITAQQDFDNYFFTSADATSIGLFQRRADQKTETFTQELTFSSTSGNLDWVAGLYYMDDDRANYMFFDFPIPALFPLPVPIQLDFQEPYYDTESRSAFIDFTWAASDRLRLGAGIRRTEEEKKEGHSFTILAQFPGGPVPIAQVCGPDLFEQEFDESENTIRT